MTNVALPWYANPEGVFSKRYFEEYQREHIISPEATKVQIAFLEEKLNLQKGMRILDMPCGHGRHTIELLKRGYRATGVDLSDYFLRKAQKAGVEAGVDTHFIHGDMRDIVQKDEYDIALNLFTALGYFESDEEDQKIFANIANSLKKGGRFVLDFVNRDWLMSVYTPNTWRRLKNGSVILYERTFDPIRGMNIDKRLWIDDQSRTESVTTLRLYTVTDFVQMGKAVGLSLIGSYGDWQDEPFERTSHRSILIFAKTA